MIQDQIKKDLVPVLKKLRIPEDKLEFEHPLDPAHGDYATNIAMRVKKKGFAGSMELASEIVNTWRSMGLPEWLAAVKVAKPGFINITLSQKALSNQLYELLKAKDKYGRLQPKKEQVMVEFAHPNTHKLFHIGHLRNISLGESISRLLEAQGIKVHRTNYQGDVGLHIAKVLWFLAKSTRKTPRTLEGKIKFLADAYVRGNRAYNKGGSSKKQIEEINQKLYAKDPELTKLWRQTKKWSLEYFDQTYKRVGTTFDRLYFESEVAEPGKEMVMKNLKKGVFEKSQGAMIFPGEKFGLHNRVFVTKQGLATYEAKDLGLAQLQFSKFDIDRVLHVVGPEQKGYFEVLFKVLEKVLPKTKGRQFHIMYGWVRLKEGKMASRAGNVIEGNWLLDEVKKEILKILKSQRSYKKAEKEAISETVAVAAVKYSLLKFSSTREIAFDIKESINIEGDSGPYLQYTYARAQSVLRKGQEKNLAASFEDWQFDQEEEIALLRTLYKFPEVVADAASSYSPNLVCSFLFDLAQKYNLFYNRHRILEPSSGSNKQSTPSSAKSVRESRLALTAATAQILKNGLNLLGIGVLERM